MYRPVSGFISQWTGGSARGRRVVVGELLVVVGIEESIVRGNEDVVGLNVVVKEAV